MMYNLDARDIARWNNLGSGAYIREGQKLRLNPQVAQASSSRSSGSDQQRTSSAPPPSLAAPSWRWPTDGRVTARYGRSLKTQSGIRISGQQGQPIAATASGQVVYAGIGLRSYGQLIIVKHNDSWLSAYGFNSRLLVSEGDQVTSGQVIAEMGSEEGGKPMLHFEIRRNGKPVDPQQYLPAR